MNKHHPNVQSTAMVAMRYAQRVKGVDPYNSHAVAAKAYDRLAPMRFAPRSRSEADANRQLVRQ